MPPYTIDDIRQAIKQLDRQLTYGCGNHGCRIKPPVGMGTNASCRCTPIEMANRLLNLSLFLEEMGRDWRHNAKVSDAPDSAAPNRE
jgi:hypothetical protein